MKNISKKIQYLFLIGAMCMSVSQKAVAFGFLPPLPPDFVVDFPGAAGKIGSNIQAAIREYQTYLSQLNSLDLDALKGMLGQAFNVSTPKSVGRGEAKAATIGNVTIEKGSVSETDYFNAYNKLFFEYPPVPGDGKITSTIMRTAYKHKADEYLQDVIIDTYVVGRITEDYMALVEKTIERLGRCQDGSDTSNCKFFGMKFSDVPAISDNAADGPGDDKGQLGVATNGYIITTMYDRVLRIIEDLTATEAVYRAAKQNSLVRPVSPQSSAEDYVGTKYRFAYHQTNETSYAKKGQFLSNYGSCEEDSTRPGCAKASHEKAELNNMASAEILGKLQQIDQWQQEAMILHNLKVQLPSYKSQYRKYLKAKEIHEQTLLALKKSDDCAKEFISGHAVKENDPDLTWDINRWDGVSGYANLVKANNQYKDRKGLSAALIADYERAVNETIMGSDGECSGYYKECPSGYVLKYKTDSDGNEVPVTCDTNSEYYACTMQVVTMDTSEIEDNKKAAENVESSDFVQSGSDEDRVATESRIKSEKGWRIGRNRLMALTEAGKLKFKPWNDQKSMQASYLRKKYNNIKTIISSTDDAFNSFKIAASRLNDKVDNNQYAAKDASYTENIDKLVRAASRCISPANVTDQMIKNTDFCNNAWIDAQHPCPANVVRNVNAGTVTASKTTGRYYDKNKGKYIYQSTSATWHQYVSTDETKCDFRRAETAFDPSLLETTSNCPKTWDLTPSFLIKNYFGEVNKMGGCKATLEGQATNMRNIATNNQRVVAWDKLADVIDKRLENDATIKAFVKKYNNEQTARKNTLTYYKNQLDNISTNIDKATKIKNAARKLKKNAESRIDSIAEELGYLTDQKTFLESQKTVDYEQICSNEVQQYKLEYERAAINGTTIVWKAPNSCNNVRKSDKSFNLDIAEVAGLSTSKYIRTFNEAYDSQKGEVIKSKDSRNVKPSETEVIITNQNTLIENYKITRDEINKKIQETQDAITAAAQNFASPSSVKNSKGEEQSYIVMATDAQEALDESNNNFEKFVEGGHRMQRTREYHCYKPLFHSRVCEPIDPNEKDNLEATMTQYIYGKGLEASVRQGLEDTWTGNSKLSSIASLLSTRMNVPTTFVVDESFVLNLGIPAGVTTTTEIVKRIRDAIVEYATTEISNEIRGSDKVKGSDKVIEEERTAAVQKVENFMTSLGLSNDEISESSLNTISEHARYGKNKNINKKHNNLITSLRKPKNAGYFGFVNGDMSSIWGIPDNLYDEGQFRDSEYFVGKPARGVKYLSNSGEVMTDSNAGRDFKAPQEPLMNLPPLREVFYFNSLDYDDMPRNGDVPTLTDFLNLKFTNLASLGIDDAEAEKWEYFPQVWLYLLARPNVRNDGGFQQTFIEDSYGDGAIQNLISGSDQEYNAIIGRAGIYPCKLKNFNSVYKYIDVAGGNDVENMRFYKRKSLPSGVAETECLEIEAKNGVTHVLADHVKCEKHNKLHDYQDDIRETDISAYSTHSELGQMFRFDDNKLKYRALQANIQEYLLNSSNSDNDINRRKAETASFKHNIFGSFLDMVNYEHNAKKNLDTAEKNVKNSLKSLCSQIHAQKMTVGAGDKVDDDEACVKVIMENGGLASSADDKIYGESGEYDKVEGVDIYAGVNRQSYRYYDKIYYLLEDQETKLLDKAMNGAEAEAPKPGEEATMCGTVKNRHCGYKNIINQYSQLEKERVQERLDSIVQFFNAFNGDKQRVLFISPDKVGKLDKELLDKTTAEANMEEEINKARADRTGVCEADDRSIISMSSQNKSVPYCPIYTKEKVN